MFGVLRTMQHSSHMTIGIIALVLLVFIAMPFLRRSMYRRVRHGSAFLPPAKTGWTPGQMREAHQLLQETQRRKAEAERLGQAQPAPVDEPPAG
jgi:hypothetical protein